MAKYFSYKASCLGARRKHYEGLAAIRWVQLKTNFSSRRGSRGVGNSGEGETALLPSPSNEDEEKALLCEAAQQRLALQSVTTRFVSFSPASSSMISQTRLDCCSSLRGPTPSSIRLTR